MSGLDDSLGKFPRVRLLEGETPIQRLQRLEGALVNPRSVRLYAKRDDLNGLGGGGNKLRKLEFIMGQALAQSCDTFITTGGMQSNHARLTAAVSAKLGLACELVLRSSRTIVNDSYLYNGNVLLDNIFGATVHELGPDADASDFMAERAKQLRKAGRRPYICVAGGSSPIGCLGYAACAQEIAIQEEMLSESFTNIVLPNGGSGTHAGLAAGFCALSSTPERLHSYAVLDEAETSRDKTFVLARETATLLGVAETLSFGDVRVSGQQRGPGYGVPTSAMFEAVQALARTEGLLADPVYGGKALAGLLDSIRCRNLPNKSAVLFLMTGGTPGLFAYEPAFRTL